jgi:hypothetical protein
MKIPEMKFGQRSGHTVEQAWDEYDDDKQQGLCDHCILPCIMQNMRNLKRTGAVQ